MVYPPNQENSQWLKEDTGKKGQLCYRYKGTQEKRKLCLEIIWKYVWWLFLVSTCLHLELIKVQTAWYTCEGFFFKNNLKWGESPVQKGAGLSRASTKHETSI